MSNTCTSYQNDDYNDSREKTTKEGKGWHNPGYMSRKYPWDPELVDDPNLGKLSNLINPDTDPRNLILESLVKAWNLYNDLDHRLNNPDDMNDFRKGIHDLQRIIMTQQYKISKS